MYYIYEVDSVLVNWLHTIQGGRNSVVATYSGTKNWGSGGGPESPGGGICFSSFVAGLLYISKNSCLVSENYCLVFFLFSFAGL